MMQISFLKLLFERKLFGFIKVRLIAAIAVIVVVSLVAVFYWIQIGNIQARNIDRFLEVSKIKEALEEYHEEFDKYPQEGFWCSLEETDPSSNRYCKNLRPALASYLSELPKDPLYKKGKENKLKGEIFSFQYKSDSAGEDYKIHVDLEIGDYQGGYHEESSDGGDDIVYNPQG